MIPRVRKKEKIQSVSQGKRKVKLSVKMAANA